MLGSVSVADNDPPTSPIYHQFAVIVQTAVVVREGRNGPAIARSALCKSLQELAAESMPAELIDQKAGAVAADLVPDRVGREEFAGGHVEGCPGTLHEPGGESQVIRMEMGDDEPGDGTVEAGQDLFPEPARLVAGEPGIHDGPAGPVPQEPEIDVVELEGQGHAQPENPRRHLLGKGRGRRVIVGIMDGHGGKRKKGEADVTIRYRTEIILAPQRIRQPGAGKIRTRPPCRRYCRSVFSPGGRWENGLPILILPAMRTKPVFPVAAPARNALRRPAGVTRGG